MKQLLILQDEEIREKTDRRLYEIAHYLTSLKPEIINQTGLFIGSAGIALFLFYYSRYKQNESIADRAMEFLLHSINEIDQSLYHTFCGGISGICWSIHHLTTNGFIDKDNAEVLELFDRYLCEQATHHSSIGNYDFLHGATGTAFYLLKRIDVPLVKQTTENIVNMLYNSRNVVNDTYCWKSKIGRKKVYVSDI